MIKKIITYSHCAVGLACASLFVEGAGVVRNNYTINNSATHKHVHSRNGVALTDGDKLIVTYAFENADYDAVSVNLNVGGLDFNFTDVVDSGISRHVGMKYLDVTSAMASASSAGTGTVNVDLGEDSVGNDVRSRLGASIIRVSGLVDGGADDSYLQGSVIDNAGTVSLDTDIISNDMFVVTGFTSNYDVVAGSDPNLSNTSYTSTYYAGVGSAFAANGYIESFNSTMADLSYNSTGGQANALIYASWTAVPEPSQASAVIALLTICFYATRRRVA